MGHLFIYRIQWHEEWTDRVSERVCCSRKGKENLMSGLKEDLNKRLVDNLSFFDAFNACKASRNLGLLMTTFWQPNYRQQCLRFWESVRLTLKVWLERAFIKTMFNFVIGNVMTQTVITLGIVLICCQVVKEEDIRNFFDSLQSRKRQRVGSKHSVQYQCR